MADQFSDPSGQRLLKDLRTLFEKGPIFETRDRHIVFVCGGKTKTRPKTMRRRFLDWSKSNIPDIIPILAEDAYRPTEYYAAPTTIDLATFETIIGEIADCVVLFPESVGSYAEIGYFAASRNIISTKTLVANCLAYQSEDSFLNLGPIRLLDQISFLKPAVQLPYLCKDFLPLKKRLRRLIGSRKRRRFYFQPYRKLDYRGKFLATLQLISLFQPVDLDGLNACVNAVFDWTKPEEIGHVVAILDAAGYLQLKDDRFTLVASMRPLLEFEGTNAQRIRTRVAYYYKKIGVETKPPK